jgi:AbrB family looped-hinge helix DNA binding protein
MSKDKQRDVLGVGTMSHKFQITIPKEAREKGKFRAGERIAFVEESGRIYIVKSTEV